MKKIYIHLTGYVITLIGLLYLGALEIKAKDNTNDTIITDTVKQHGNKDTNQIEVRHIVLKGTNKEIGEALGKIAQKDYGTNNLMSVDRNIFDKREKCIQKNYRAFHERMKGVSNAYHYNGDKTQDASFLPYDLGGNVKCSAVFFPASSTETKHNMFIRNFDWNPGLPMFSRVYVMELYPTLKNNEEKPQYPSIVIGGLDLLNGVIDGINSQGLMISALQDQTIDTKHDKGIEDIETIEGLSIFQVMRCILDTCTTVEDAKNILKSIDKIDMIIVPLHLMIADSTGNNVVFEMSLDSEGKLTVKNFVTRSENNSPRIITNHSLKKYEIQNPPEYHYDPIYHDDPYNTFLRYDRLKNALPKRIDLWDIIGTVTAKGIEYETQLPVRTMWIVLFDLNDKVIKVKFYKGDDREGNPTFSNEYSFNFSQ